MSLSQRTWKFDAIDKKECPRQLGKDVPVNKQDSVNVVVVFMFFVISFASQWVWTSRFPFRYVRTFE